MIPFIGRMDDIWASYLLQSHFPDCVIYGEATVYQKKNEQDITQNITDELIGYKNTFNFIKNLNNYKYYLPQKSVDYLDEYHSSFVSG